MLNLALTTNIETQLYPKICVHILPRQFTLVKRYTYLNNYQLLVLNCVYKSNIHNWNTSDIFHWSTQPNWQRKMNRPQILTWMQSINILGALLLSIKQITLVC